MSYKKYMCNYKEHSLESKISNICTNEYMFFLNKRNVVGIGRGYKSKNGFCTNKQCIQVFVISKVSECRLFSEDIIPTSFRGIPTDIIETGNFTPSSLREKIRPIKGGYSISLNKYLGDGTAGCLVTNGIRKFVLSSNHILANENLAPIGSEIIQPAYKYGGKSKDLFARLSKFVPMRPIEGEQQPINFSDAAIAELVDYNIMSSEIAYIGNVSSVKSPKLGGRVQKVGSATELTTGTITSTDSTLRFTYTSGKRYMFSNMILTTRMSEIGDSGSILVNDNKCAVGMLTATAANSTSFCRLDTILDQLGIQLVQ